MSEKTWTEVEHYIEETLVGSDSVLKATLAESDADGLPPISVSPNQGKLLQILARAIGARRILEMGTLGGYSTIWLARAVPQGGRVVTLEADAHHAEVARANFARSGLDDIIELRFGKAHKTLPKIAAEGSPPFDFIFIDADKKRIPEYFDWAVKLSRPGSMIVVDNVVRNGAVADAASRDAAVLGVRRLHEQIAKDRRVMATAIQTVGAKGYDGFTIALVVRPD